MASAMDQGTVRPGSRIPAETAIHRPLRVRLAEWLDGQSRQLFIMPAVVLILIFSIFPLVASLVLAFSRLRLTGNMRFVGFDNFEKQIFGSEQFHFLGTFGEISVAGWVLIVAAGAAILWWLLAYARSGFTWVGFIGRLITAALGFGLAMLLGATLLSGQPFGTLGVTLFYVFVGCAFQFAIGLGLAFLCAQPIRGRTFFRVVFFLPLMITPIGVGYAFRMMADTTKGPLAPAWQWLGLGDFAWAADPWAARVFIVVGDSWQWIPFIFVVLLAALENIPRDFVEAGEVDGASRWQIFREITWPQIMPVAATVLLIRMIEAFKIVDLPNIMTSGGPGIATESMTLHAFFSWRALDLGEASAVAYLLLFVTVIVCVSFFNLVVLKRVRTA
jgi:multiple sugar transport system permease protein